jgi:hypothetical protein
MKTVRAFANMTPEQQRSHLLEMHGLYSMKRKGDKHRKGTHDWKHDHDGAVAIQHVHSPGAEAQDQLCVGNSRCPSRLGEATLDGRAGRGDRFLPSRRQVDLSWLQ